MFHLNQNKTLTPLKKDNPESTLETNKRTLPLAPTSYTYIIQPINAQFHCFTTSYKLQPITLHDAEVLRDLIGQSKVTGHQVMNPWFRETM